MRGDSTKDYKSDPNKNPLGVLRLHEGDQIDDAVGITKLVIIPRNKLDESLGQLDPSLGVEDRGTSVAQEVCGDHHLIRVAQETLQWPGLARLLDLFANIFVGSSFLQADGEVHDGDVLEYNR